MATPTNALHVALGRHPVTICHQFTALTRSACAMAAYKKPLAGFEPAPQSISLPDDRGRKESALRIVSVTRVKCPPLCIELQRHINSPFLRWSAQGRAVIFGHTRGRLISTALAFRGLRLVESKSFGGILEKKGLAVSKGEKEPKRCAAYGYRGKLPVVHGAMCPLRPTGSAGSGADGRNQTATTRCLLLVLSFHTSAYKEPPTQH